MYDKNYIRENITDEQMFDLLGELGGEPISQPKAIVCKTICHCGNSHKLYYFHNTHLFKCFTDCGDDAFDIFELVRKIKTQELNKEVQLPSAIRFVANYFNFAQEEEDSGFTLTDTEEDFKILDNYKRIQNIELAVKKVELKTYDDAILSRLPQPRILDWEDEGIKREVELRNNIRYNPSSEGIVIPHYDIDNRLIGIRERTLIKENEKYGKYRPSILNKVMYNHPLSFVLYNLNNSKDNIKNFGRAIVFEGEKSTLLYASYFGMENDISVACCGSSLIQYQVDLLLGLGVEEIIVAFDKQFKKIGDKDWEKWTKKLRNIHQKYGKSCQISFMFDKEDLLNFKDSPIDQGPDVFIELFNRRVIL